MGIDRKFIKSSKDKDKKTRLSSSSKFTVSKKITFVETSHGSSTGNDQNHQGHYDTHSTRGVQSQNISPRPDHSGPNLGQCNTIQRGLGAGLPREPSSAKLTQTQGGSRTQGDLIERGLGSGMPKYPGPGRPSKVQDQSRSQGDLIQRGLETGIPRDRPRIKLSPAPLRPFFNISTPDSNKIRAAGSLEGPSPDAYPIVIDPPLDKHGGVTFPAGRNRGADHLFGRIQPRQAEEQGWPIIYTENEVQGPDAPVEDEDRVVERRTVIETETFVTRTGNKSSSKQKQWWELELELW